MMKILAFMQNMWVRDPVRVQAAIVRYGEEYRRRLIHYALFAGCLSGRRLRAAFGHDLCDMIQWDEASRVIASHAAAAPPADPEHIRSVIAHHQPGIVLAFGRTASDAVRSIWRGPLIQAPHPDARQADTPTRLGQAAATLRAVLSADADRLQDACTASANPSDSVSNLCESRLLPSGPYQTEETGVSGCKCLISGLFQSFQP